MQAGLRSIGNRCVIRSGGKVTTFRYAVTYDHGCNDGQVVPQLFPSRSTHVITLSLIFGFILKCLFAIFEQEAVYKGFGEILKYGRVVPWC